MSIILGGISVIFIHKTTLDNSIKYMQEITVQINDNIDSYIKYMESISYMLKDSSDVKKFLLNNDMGQQQKLTEERITEQIGTILKIRQDIYNIAIIATNERYILNDGDKINPYIDVTEKMWYKTALGKNGVFTISSSHVQDIIEYQYPWVVSLSSAILDNGHNIGVLLVDLNYKVIDNLCKRIQLEDKGYIFIIDELGNTIYHPRQNLIYSGLKTEPIDQIMASETNHFIIRINEEEYLYNIAKSEASGWRVVGVVKTKDLLTYSTMAMNTYFIATIIIVGAAVALFIKLSKRITRPIRILEDAMKRFEIGEFKSAEVEILENNEIGRLGKTFNRMNQKIQQLIEEKVQDEKLKRQSEMRALQAQINPHFLYNTLDSIIWMAESGKNSEVIKMTAELARFLRQNISNERELISIEQEMSYVKSYLNIQKMRYRDQLNYTIHVSDEIKNYHIIKLMIQPLIENAIYHGIKYKNEQGHISIRANEQSGKIMIEIIDDGVGMDEVTLNSIFQKKETSFRNNGVGVYNVYSRLKLQYGVQGEISYESIPHQGTKVKILIPKE